MRTFVLVACFALLLAASVHASQLHGTIYDTDLGIAKQVLVEIDTQPRQRQLSMTGNYTFDVPPGTYHLRASYKIGNRTLTSEDNVTFLSEGAYRFDLLLFPGLEDDAALVGAISDIAVAAPETPFDTLSATPIAPKTSTLLVVTLLVSSVAVFAFLMLATRKQARESAIAAIAASARPEDGASAKALSLLAASGGRMLQRDLRKQMGDSEAKVSLLLAELEHKGLVEKIKRGRGNIIVLKAKA